MLTNRDAALASREALLNASWILRLHLDEQIRQNEKCSQTEIIAYSESIHRVFEVINETILEKIYQLHPDMRIAKDLWEGADPKDIKDV